MPWFFFFFLLCSSGGGGGGGGGILSGHLLEILGGENGGFDGLVILLGGLVSRGYEFGV